MAVVAIINEGRSRDCFLQSCLRELCFVAVTAEFEVRAVHIPGRQNVLPDLLSRWHLASKFPQQCMQLICDVGLDIVRVEESLFFFTCDW